MASVVLSILGELFDVMASVLVRFGGGLPLLLLLIG